MKGTTPEVGLCQNCRHAKEVKNNRGSVFWRCLLADKEPDFPRYPRLPVRECEGFSEREG